MFVVFRWLSMLPLGLLQATGTVLGWVVFLVSPTYRKRFLAHAAQAGYRFRDVTAAVGHAGRMVAELPRLWLGAPLPFIAHGEHYVQQALEAGKGLVFFTPHMGCFELSPQAVALRFGSTFGPITVLYRPARQKWLAKVMETARNRPGMQAVPTNLMGVRQMIRALRQGQSVGLLPDQVPPEGLGLWAPFFGRDAYTMTLGARMVQQTGAAVLLVRTERLSWGRGFVIYFEPIPAALVHSSNHALSTDLEQAVNQINKAMEYTIAQCPSQYLWGYGRYKQPRTDKSVTQKGGAQ
jgi:Kdo2-lipid IVA lauroyltransferase/acyltransferase